MFVSEVMAFFSVDTSRIESLIDTFRIESTKN